MGLILVAYTARFAYLHGEIVQLRGAVSERVGWAVELERVDLASPSAFAELRAVAADMAASTPQSITAVDDAAVLQIVEALAISTAERDPAEVRRAAKLIRKGTSAISVRLGELLDQNWSATLFGSGFGAVGLALLALWLVSVRALDEWRSRWARLASVAADGTWDWDVETGQVQFSGSASPKRAGFDMGSIDEWFAQIHPEDRQGVRRALDLHMSGEYDRFEAEFRVVGPEAELRHFLARGVASRENGRRPGHFTCWQTDITDRRQAAEAEQRVRQSEIELRRAIDAVPAVVVILRGDEVIYANTAAETAFGTGGESQAAYLVLRSAAVERGPARLLTRSGVQRAWEVAPPTTIMMAGEPAVVLVARDVSERIQMEGQLRGAERMIALGGLAAGLAHEINNPLTYIIGNLELAQEGVGDVPARIARALGGAVRVRQVVAQLRNLAHPAAGDLVLVDLGPAVETAVTMALGVGHSPATIQRDFSGAVATLANPIWLGQIALNLITNALQAMSSMPRAARALRLSAHSPPEGGAILEFADSGPGLAPEVAERLFEPFTTSRLQSGGTGLGLYICRELATRMGGTLELAETSSAGTTFRLCLPGVALQPALEAVDKPAIVRRRGRVLVVDDERVIVELLASYLGHHEVSCCHDAASASVELAKGGWDAVVLDIILPDRSGIELFDEIERVAPELADRVLFVTGGSLATDVARFLMRAPNPALLKPFDFRELVAQVDRLVALAPIAAIPAAPPPSG